MDPLSIYQTLDASGLTFRETGAFLFTLENSCGAITASAHISVSEAISTGIRTHSQNGFNAFYANGHVLVDTQAEGLLELRNVAGQLLCTQQVAKGAKQHAIPFNGQADGVYIATLRSEANVDVMRFMVR